MLVDATVGGGGHAGALLAAHPGLVLVGLDRDDAALDAAGEALAPFGDRVTLRRARFDQLTDNLEDLGHANGSAVLFDLGVSSPQLDVAERGFSYRHDGPLDMRMDRRQRRTAADVVNGYPSRELARVLRALRRRALRHPHRPGDRRRPTRSQHHASWPRSCATPSRRRPAAPAATRPSARSRPLRIEVNDELAILADSIDQAIDFLAPGGRCAVLAYHSGEDRIVKERFRHHATGGVDAAARACPCPTTSSRP